MGEGDGKIPVTKDICKILHEQVQKDMGEVKEHMGMIDQSILALQGISQENQTIIKILMEEREARLKNSPGDTKDKAWKQPWFKYIVFTGCAAMLALIVLAVGKELIISYVDALKTIPH